MGGNVVPLVHAFAVANLIMGSSYQDNLKMPATKATFTLGMPDPAAPASVCLIAHVNYFKRMARVELTCQA